MYLSRSIFFQRRVQQPPQRCNRFCIFSSAAVFFGRIAAAIAAWSLAVSCAAAAAAAAAATAAAATFAVAAVPAFADDRRVLRCCIQDVDDERCNVFIDPSFCCGNLEVWGILYRFCNQVRKYFACVCC